MVIYDLECHLHHTFECWFNTVQSFDTQMQEGLVQCPHCGSNQVTKKPTGFHIGSKNTNSPKVTADVSVKGDKTPAFDPVILLKNLNQYVEKNFKDVGKDFCDKAIAMHKGLSPLENIYGELTLPQKEKLEDEGVDYMTIPKLDQKFEN